MFLYVLQSSFAGCCPCCTCDTIDLVNAVCAGILEDAEETLAELAGRAQRIRESLSQSVQREDETASFLRARQLELEDEQRKLQELADSARSIESEIDALKHSLVLQEDEARLLASSLDTTIESIQMQLRYLQRYEWGTSSHFCTRVLGRISGHSQVSRPCLASDRATRK